MTSWEMSDFELTVGASFPNSSLLGSVLECAEIHYHPYNNIPREFSCDSVWLQRNPEALSSAQLHIPCGPQVLGNALGAMEMLNTRAELSAIITSVIHPQLTASAPGCYLELSCRAATVHRVFFS